MSSITRGISYTVAFLLVLIPIMVNAQDISGGSLDLGKKEFESRCAICHGANGEGQGTWKGMLKVAPADLTVLAKNNKGVFPFDKVHSIIDGRADVKAHGSREMPIWGDVYNIEAAKYYSDYFGTHDPEYFIKARIYALISYLGDLQK